MEATKIYSYQLKGHENLEEFAKGILFLVNQRSSVENTVIEFRTFDGSDMVELFAHKQGDYDTEFDRVLKHHFKEIVSKEEATLLMVGEYEDYTKTVHQKIDELQSDDGEYIIVAYQD
ncbi:hypothetical protein [Exiguobacterium sp. BG5(2022)]|uniref:hypothetical protein n=1 Tax=Exiguobacterium sp. BG5(2022) TaxID=2962595 RepID=UPI0028818F98|nr:hypothetical protein [Exiguobacterium sp. BG5(2022)]MDT0193716.1 hypothetical protein [Exiguobacterium sp. BG5(2022)]